MRCPIDFAAMISFGVYIQCALYERDRKPRTRDFVRMQMLPAEIGNR